MKKKTKILFIGPIPQPFGGVSVHIFRLSELLKKDFCIDFIDESNIKKDKIFNIRGFNIFRYLLKILKSDIIHIHSGKTFLRFFHLTISKILFKKVVITLHSYPERKKTLYRILDELILNLSNMVIIVNPIFLDRLKITTKFSIKEAFLPPNIENEKELNKVLLDLIEQKKEHGLRLIVANAWRLEKFRNEDLYGLDLCIEVAKLLQRNNVPFFFVFIVSSKNDSLGLYENYQKQIQENNLAKDFILMNEEVSFIRLIQNADIVVRPTNTDGDALTVREALHLNKPIIASDVTNRPEGTILFNNRDLKDFMQKIEETLLNYNNLIFSQNNIENYEEYYVKLFNDCLNKM